MPLIDEKMVEQAAKDAGVEVEHTIPSDTNRGPYKGGWEVSAAKHLAHRLERRLMRKLCKMGAFHLAGLIASEDE